MDMGIGCAASIITIVYSACDLARNIKELIRNVKQHDENLKDLEDKLDTLKDILKHANEVYGQNGSKSSSPLEQQIRKTIEKVVVGCNKDLKRFEAKLKSLFALGNWASVALKQKLTAPDLAEIGKSLSDRQQRLSMGVQLLQGLELRELLDILRQLSHTFPNKGPSATSEDQNDDTDSLKQMATALIAEAESAARQERRTPVEDKEPQSPELLKSKENGLLLLEAIEKGDQDAFESLLSNGETSLVEKDSRDRTPLLLAASLGKGSMVNMILSSKAGAENSTHQLENTTKDTQTRNRREIDLTAIDSDGRTVLHYSAEFGLHKEAGIILNHDVSIDARDYNDRPPAYYAAKFRKLEVMKLLLENGASVDFDRATSIGTSEQIEELLKKASEDKKSASASGLG